MKLIIVLIATIIANVNTSNISNVAEVTTEQDVHDITLTSSSEESGPIRLIFPKRPHKFIAQKSTKSSKENDTTPVNRTSKKPVFKIIQKAVKMKSRNYWKTATRRPSLMKYTKYTINPFTNSPKHRYSVKLNKQSNKGKEIKRKNEINEFRKSINASDEDDSSEELDTIKASKKRKDKVKHIKTLIHRFHKLGSKINREKHEKSMPIPKEADDLINKHKGHTDVIKVEADFSPEEKEDRKEFIFVTQKQIEHDVRVMDNSDESDETTTSMTDNNFKLRPKRSVNVIEEENFGTTVSGFKFTGKVASLSNDLVFRNINT